MALLGRENALVGFAGFWMLLTLGDFGFSMAAENANDQWQNVNATNVAVLDLAEGQIIIELSPDFAPLTVAQFKRLAREGFYDGQSFYRVIDGFVAQGGDGSDMGEANAEPTIEAEFEREWSDRLPFVSVQMPDMFAPETGFIDGFAAARDTTSDRVWLVHCPGTVAMARLEDPDSSSTDFYIVIGQAPRYLDRNLSVFGRVVYGMDVVQRLRRGPASNGGVIENEEARSVIQTVRIAADVPENERPVAQVLNSNSDEFRTMLETRRHREADFFFHKPTPVLDVCQIPNQGRRELDQ